ncbi:MAG: radical SAM protein, partial [Candidatus Aegiribacteria sp.]|nr:radical SAM protein [Candidatus Aegiribacteria sp.]
MLVFGPVPSRRLGRSIGINNIPPKICTYSCVYCQVGRTTEMSTVRSQFYEPEAILNEVRKKLQQCNAASAQIDYLTIVPDGEPTLDINLEELLKILHNLGLSIAVISNSSLIWDPEVRHALQVADWVSLKVDSVIERTWRKIDRPHGKLSLSRILEGVQTFAEEYEGKLVTETMLVRNLNDRPEELHAIGEFLEHLKPECAYISVPTRPPAERRVCAPSEDSINMAYNILIEHLDNVEYLIDYEGDEFTPTDDVESDLLGILSVHPMRETAVLKFLSE